MQYLLGVDVGTTGTKTILFREDGKIMGQSYCAYPTQNPQVGYSEQNPEDWWNSVCQTVREVSADPEVRSNIVAISMSTQGGTMVGLDKDGKPVRPALVWSDKRCQEELEEFRSHQKALDVYRICGWNVSAAAPMLQCCWLQKHEIDNFSRIHRFLSVPDYLAWRMTGMEAIDISNAGVCRFTDIQKGDYSQELLAYSGLRAEQLPRILPSAEPIGKLTAEAAEALHLTQNVLLVSGAHDQYAVALGAGACNNGDILIGSGTSWVVMSIADEPDFESGLPQSVTAVPGKWGSLWSLSTGGVCLEWWRKKLTADADGTLLPFDVINEEVAKKKAAEDGLFFYPFTGRATNADRFQKASFVGLDLSHDRFHLARAIMEGVAFQIVWTMRLFRAKPSKEGIKLAGGASKSKLWCQMVADIANLPVRIPETADLACVGAAIMAGVGCGLYPDAQSGYDKLAVADRVILPDPERAEVYKKLYSQYQEFAACLGDMYDKR